MERDLIELITEYKREEKKKRLNKLVIVAVVAVGTSILAGIATNMKDR